MRGVLLGSEAVAVTSLLVFLLAAPCVAWCDQPNFYFPMRALAADTSLTPKLYAGTETGLFRSADGGATWSPLYIAPAGQPQPWVTSLAIDPGRPSVLYAATGFYPRCVVTSTDEGPTWMLSNHCLPH